MRISDWSSDVCSSDLLQRQQAAISEADAGVKSARADLARTDDDLKRYRQLAASNYAPNQKLESATADQRKDRAALEKGAAGQALEQNQTPVLTENGRASCRERGWQYGSIPGLA